MDRRLREERHQRGGRDPFRSLRGTFAIYRSPDDEYFATGGLCTHENVHLADGFVAEDLIECPKHSSSFNYRTGEVKGPPAIDLKTYPVRVENDRVLIEV